LASELDWRAWRDSPRTLEGWLYEWRAHVFGALEHQSRRDKGLSKAILPQAAEAISQLRLKRPSLAISTLVRQFEQSGLLQPRTFSLSSVYRLTCRCCLRPANFTESVNIAGLETCSDKAIGCFSALLAPQYRFTIETKPLDRRL
jgi:hypothetical protein